MSSLECVICLSGYNDTDRRPCIGVCGHSICESCKCLMRTSKCPHCNREEAFAILTINYQVLELLKHGPPPNTVSGVRSEKFEEGPCSECGTMTRKLRICVQCGVNSNILVIKNDVVTINEEVNTIESGLLAVRNTAICGDCALDGIHSAHKICGLALLKKEYENLLRSETKDRIEKKISLDVGNQIQFVESYKKSYPTSNPTIADMNPVLIADRKQSVREPLLVGILDPATDTWSSIGRMPNPKSNYAVAQYSNKIFIVGGMNAGTWLSALEVYDRDKNLRKDGAKLKNARTRTSAGFFDKKMFVCGGYNGAYMNSVEIYDPDTNTWVDGPNLKKHRADCAVVTANGELYVLGGYNGKEYEEAIEKYNNNTRQFEIVGEMQGSRAGFGACFFRGRIYVGGGWSNSNNTLRTTRSYDPLTNGWREEPSFVHERKYFTMHATSETIYAVRGCRDNWSLISEVEKLDLRSNHWKPFPCNPLPLSPSTSTSSSPSINSPPIA
ncbi:unnamed protein product [Caenorhabditis bovis]|uniref:RING-type domain-containing protein n=1 Tax=Caenorhabditis bovis TaxID=2654633 RepID=A0A8S1E6V4_9PELO|nr:unnamed protein product [Caenorhabditis bovis]